MPKYGIKILDNILLEYMGGLYMYHQANIVQEGFDKVTCWSQSRIGTKDNLYILNTQKLKLAGSDVYGLVHSCYSYDRGRTWSELKPQEGLKVEGGSIADTTPKYHEKTGKFLMLGQWILKTYVYLEILK